jgi:hypothetical protein
MINDSLDNVYARIRAEEREALSRRIDDAYFRAPRLKELTRSAQSSFPIWERAESLPKRKLRLEEIAKEERDILLSLGLAENTLRLHERCELCHDTGMSAQQPTLACRLLNRERLRGSAEGVNERETFAHFSSSIFPTPEQKKRTLNARAIAKPTPNPCPPRKNRIFCSWLCRARQIVLGNAIAYEALTRV